MFRRCGERYQCGNARTTGFRVDLGTRPLRVAARDSNNERQYQPNVALLSSRRKMKATVDLPSPSVLAVLGRVDEATASLLVDSLKRIPQVLECWIVLTAINKSLREEQLLQQPPQHQQPQGDCGKLESPSAQQHPPFPPGKLESGPGRSEYAVTAGDINAVACLLDAVALSARPRLRCVPLLKVAGWSQERIAGLPAGYLLALPARPPSGELTSTGLAHASCQGAPGGVGPISGELPVGHDAQPIHQEEKEQQDSREQGPGLLSYPDQTGLQSQGHPRQRQPQANRAESDPEAGAAAWERAASVVDHLDALRPAHLPPWVRCGSTAPECQGELHRHQSDDQQVSQRTTLDPASHGATMPAPALLAATDGSDPTREEASASSGSRPAATSSNAAAAGKGSAREGSGYTTLVDGVPAPEPAALQFRRVAVGGTFDRLHAGHELLLAATALVSSGFVYVGVTADALLANKSHKELLQPYAKRVEEAVSYIRAVHPNLQVQVGPLSDPKAPTLAELDPDMEALVVSVETLPGGAAINAGRRARGFRPLTVVTVPVIGLRKEGDAAGGPTAASKLSSSGLRAQEAATVEHM